MTSGRPCPICSKPAEAKFRPFCSKRCADIDLGRWFDGAYRLPSEEPPDPEELGEVVPFPPRDEDNG